MKKGIRKILSLFLAFALSFSCIATIDINAFADEYKNPTILVESKSVVLDNDTSIDVKIVNNPGLAGAKIILNYSDKLTLLEAKSGDTFAELDYTEPANLQSGCAFNWDSLNEEVKQDGVLLTLKFGMASSVKANEELPVSISYQYGDIYNKNLDSLEFDVVNGMIKVISYTPGDVNGDHVVNGKDVTLIRRYNAGYNVSINKEAADVNDDGTINGKDVTLIRRYNAGASVVLKPSTPKCNHSLQTVAYKAASCEEEGNTAYWHCTKCDKYFADADAVKEVELKDTVIPSLGGHTPVIDPAVPATTTSTGLTEGSHCSVCNKILVAQKTTPMLQKTEYTITYNISGNDPYLAQQNITRNRFTPTITIKMIIWNLTLTRAVTISLM